MSAHPAPPPRWTPHRLTPWLALLATLALVALLSVRREPPPPLGPDAPASRFSAARAEAVLVELLAAGDGEIPARPTGSPAADQVRRRLVERLVELGVPRSGIELQRTVTCRESERWSWADCAPVTNVVAPLPTAGGARPDGPAVVLLAHYDSVAAGPGVSDDAAGVAALLEVARALLAEGGGGVAHRHPVVLLVTDAEEVGLHGARAFVEQHPLAAEGSAGIGAVINLEARGTTGQSLLFQTSADDAWLVDLYRRAPRPVTSSLYAEIYRRLPNDTDLSVFLDAGLTGLNLAWAEGVARYHTPRDDLVHLDRGSLQHQGDNALHLARSLAGHPRLAEPPRGRAVYTDVLGLFVLSYPLGAALPLAAAVLVGLLVVATLAVRRGESRRAGLGVAVAALLGGTALAAGLAFALGHLVSALAGSARPAWAHPLPFRAALWALVFLAVLAAVAAALRLGRHLPSLRVSAWSLALAGWLIVAVLGVLFAVVAPGVSLYPVMPAAVALLAGATATGLPHRPRARDAAVVAAALATAFFWFQIASFVELGMGLHRAVLVAVPVALAALGYAPLLAPAPSGSAPSGSRAFRWALPALLGLGVLAGTTGAVLVPPHSVAAPQGVSVIHYQDAAGSGGTADDPASGAEAGAKIFVDPGADDAPRAVLAAAGFGGARVEAPRALRVGAVHAASTEPADLAAPSLEVLEVTELAEGRRVRFRLAGFGADRLRLDLPADSRPSRLRVDGREIAWNPDAPLRGRHVLACTGQPCDGLEIEVDLGTDEPVTAELLAVHHAATRPLPEAARRVAAARPPWAVPVHRGDRTVVRNGVILDPPEPRAGGDGDGEDGPARPDEETG